MEYALRPARTDDAAFLRAVEAAVMQSHATALWGRYLPAEYPTLFDLANTRIVMVGGQDVGNLTIEREAGLLRLRKLYLVAAVQGRGLGKALLAQVAHEADRQGLPLRLSVLRPNARALAFYLREGLQVVEETEERLFLMRSTAEARPQRPL